MIKVSRLLKSWATRPATTPIASSRCAWTRVRSARRTSLKSTPATRTVPSSAGDVAGSGAPEIDRSRPSTDRVRLTTLPVSRTEAARSRMAGPDGLAEGPLGGIGRPLEQVEGGPVGQAHPAVGTQADQRHRRGFDDGPQPRLVHDDRLRLQGPFEGDGDQRRQRAEHQLLVRGQVGCPRRPPGRPAARGRWWAAGGRPNPRPGRCGGWPRRRRRPPPRPGRPRRSGPRPRFRPPSTSGRWPRPLPGSHRTRCTPRAAPPRGRRRRPGWWRRWRGGAGAVRPGSAPGRRPASPGAAAPAGWRRPAGC